MTSLSGLEERQLNEVLRSAFTKAKLEQMLRYRLDKSLEDIAMGDDYVEIVFRLIRTTEMESWTPALIAAARESNPGNPRLLAFAEQFGLTPLTPGSLPATRLESIIKQTNGFLDVDKWRTKLGELEVQVCRVEFQAQGKTIPNGTGFLVGPSAVLTNYHVVKPVLDGEYEAKRLVLRFDYKRSSDGKTLNKGVKFKPAADWLVDYSEYSPLDIQPDASGSLPQPDQLDYALIRVEEEPGNQPAGGEKAAPGDPPRGWVKVSDQPYPFQANTPLFIMQHPDGDPLKLAFDTESVISVNGNRTRVRHKTNTEGGSSGSPCFNINWELVALHHSGDPNFKSAYNQGIPIDSVMNLLRKRGKDGEVGESA